MGMKLLLKKNIKELQFQLVCIQIKNVWCNFKLQYQIKSSVLNKLFILNYTIFHNNKFFEIYRKKFNFKIIYQYSLFKKLHL